MANDALPEVEASQVRRYLAFGLTALSIAGVILLSFVMIRGDKSPNADTSKYVMGTVLPLIGTWVGTILAHYFSKENFEAATRSVAEIARQITPQEKLKSLPAKSKWIPQASLVFWTLPADKDKTLFAIRDELRKQNKGQRIPILSGDKHPLYLIHQSTIDEYLSDQLGQQPPPDSKTLTLQKFLDDNKDALAHTFATIKEDATLADAKEAMDSLPDCQDVFVTKGGTQDEEVLGWITNVIIQDNAKV